CIATGDAKTITRAQGVGPKVAQRIVMELKDKVGSFASGGAAPEDFDLIVTGDLGKVGKEILVDQFHQIGVNLGDRYTDCGVLVFDLEGQDVHAGGSGCGCSAIVLCGYLLDQLRQGKLHRILFCGTGALLSPTSSQQGESIPGVCHAVSISTERK
ncbi:MAG: stage V sporulation protein AD, partial [Firmicutes bacterium]|nr:stage V sporulation protein AD [Bacillota bacterium]